MSYPKFDIVSKPSNRIWMELVLYSIASLRNGFVNGIKFHELLYLQGPD